MLPLASGAPTGVTLEGGASALTAQFDCTTAYLGTVDYFTFTLVRTDGGADVQVLPFTTNPADPSYVAKGTPTRTGDTCTFTIAAAAIPDAANRRGTFKLQLVRRRGARCRPRTCRAGGVCQAGVRKLHGRAPRPTTCPAATGCRGLPTPAAAPTRAGPPPRMQSWVRRCAHVVPARALRSWGGGGL